MRIRLAPPLKCPKCGAVEEHPDGEHIVIRGLKVHDQGKWWSQCLRCSGGYDANLVWNAANHNPDKGWFPTD